MLNHVVMIKFKKTVTAESIQEMEAMLEDLPNKITEIHTYEFGGDILHSERSYDFALVSLFANMEALQRYQVHPEHQKLLKKLVPLCDHICTVDFMGTDASDFKENPKKEDLGSWDIGPKS